MKMRSLRYQVRMTKAPLGGVVRRFFIFSSRNRDRLVQENPENTLTNVALTKVIFFPLLKSDLS